VLFQTTREDDEQMGKVEKLAVILLGLLIAFVALYYNNDCFISKGVAPATPPFS